MAAFPEREKALGIEERPEEISSLKIERKEVVRPTPTQFTAQVRDDKDQPLIQTPTSQTVTVTVPAPGETELKALAKGDTEEALTWWAASWIRAIKRALHLGWNLVFGKK